MTVAQIDRYLKHQADIPPEHQKLLPAHKSLRQVVVIPVYDELEHIERTVESLAKCPVSPDSWELIVVANNSTDAPESVVARNRQTIEKLRDMDTAFPIHVLDRATRSSAYRPEASGVGYARREGCDLALTRLANTEHSEDGYIVCLDGDAPVDKGYLEGITREMDRAPEAHAGVCRYRHRTEGFDPAQRRAIANYESWLRYVHAGLVATGTPYGTTTIGSTIVFRASGYALADGFARRASLADFYSLLKVIKTDGRRRIKHLFRPMVYPSGRISERVARGTGAGVTKRLEADRVTERVVAPEFFNILSNFMDRIPTAYRDFDRFVDRTEPFIDQFIRREYGGWDKLERIRANTSKLAQFRGAFHTWFDGLKIMRLMNSYGKQVGKSKLHDAITGLINHFESLQSNDLTGDGSELFKPNPSPEKLLHTLRQLEPTVLETAERLWHSHWAGP